MRTRRRAYITGMVCAVAAALAGCAPSSVKSGTDGGLDQDERVLVARADAAAAEIQRKGLVLRDAVVTDYVRRVGARVVPSGTGLQFHIARDSNVNAFAFPNGDIFITIGLLARLENETQLAFVLAHEAAHVYAKHGLESARRRRSTVIAAHVADLVLFGTSIAYLPFAGSLAHYNRDQEDQADAVALKWLAEANYPANSIPTIFKTMTEREIEGPSQASIWSSHPTNDQREQRITALLRSGNLAITGAPDEGVERFRAVRKRIVHANIKLKLRHGQFQLARRAADEALRHDPVDPWLYYFRGESSRRMGAEPKTAAREQAWIQGKKDVEQLTRDFESRRHERFVQARADFERALYIDPSFIYAKRGLGLVAYETGEHEQARDALRQYLQGEQPIRDARYIRTLLEGLGDE